MLPKRHNKTWTINECLSLQREYELLKLSIYQIAKLHKRKPSAISYKIQSEYFVQNYHNYYDDNGEICVK